MATIPTKNPVPSESPADLKFNASKIDEEVSSKTKEYYDDRFGGKHLTNYGRERLTLDSINNYGYITIDSFEDGAIIGLPNQILRYKATGEYFRWDGEFLPAGAGFVGGSKHVPPGSTPESSGGVGLNAWVSVGDGSLRSNLKDPNIGTSLISLFQGGLLSHAILYLTPQMFGAKGDFNKATQTGSNDTSAIKAAIKKSIELGGWGVKLPGGFKYYVDKEINLGGEDYYGINGVPFSGDGVDSTQVFFKADNDDSVCFSSRGGSGTGTSKSLSGLTILSSDDTRKGIGLLLEGSCLFYTENVNIRFLSVGVKLHNNLAGSFTEFNRFYKMRIDRNKINVLYTTTHGDNSFHGIQWESVQNQLLDGYDGIVVESFNGGYAHLYNNRFGMNFFGSVTGTPTNAIRMSKCTCDYSSSNMTFEGDVILKSTDDSWFHCDGIFDGYNGTLKFDTPIPARLSAPACFIFDNTASLPASFSSDASLNGLRPAIYKQNYSNRAINGAYPGLFRIRGTGTEIIAWSILKNSSLGFVFGTINPGGRLEDFSLSYNLNQDGTAFNAPKADILYLNNKTTGVMLRGDAFTNRNANQLTNGSADYKWNTIYSVNGTINTSDATQKTEPRNPTDEENEAFYEIAQLPWVWQWLSKYEKEGDEARLHSGPTVQAAIEIVGRHGLKWTDYSCFCYDSWQEQEEIIRVWDAQPAVYETIPARRTMLDDDEITEVPEHRILVTEAIEAGSEITQEYSPAGGEYSFRKDELLLWVVRAIINKQKSIEERLRKLEIK